MLDDFVSNLNKFLIGNVKNDSNIIRKHTKKLESLGDVSFPLDWKNWYHLLNTNEITSNTTIFDYLHAGVSLEEQLQCLKEESNQWLISISKLQKIDNDISLHLERVNVFAITIGKVLECSNSYGTSNILNSHVNVIIDNKNVANDLSQLRLSILHDTLNNLIKCSTSKDVIDECSIYLSLKPVKNSLHMICGPILNKDGLKDTVTTAEEIFEDRQCYMRECAQHRFHVSVKNNSAWQAYFVKLGHAAVIIEMLSVKPQKASKLSSAESETPNKGPAFIFYNCARLSAIFKEFNKRIANETYPPLPNIHEIDFSVLNQPEEWELLYVYVLQYPMVVKSCIKDITKAIFNPQNLVQFLSNLSSVFSVYYRRVKILIDPQAHLYKQIQARIYLLMALEIVFHNALKLLNIDPVEKM